MVPLSSVLRGPNSKQLPLIVYRDALTVDSSRSLSLRGEWYRDTVGRGAPVIVKHKRSREFLFTVMVRDVLRRRNAGCSATVPANG